MTAVARIRVAAMARTLGITYWAVMAATGIAVVLTPSLRESRAEALVVLAVSAVALVRAMLLGVRITSGQFVFRSWFRTYRLESSTIRRFAVTPYSGMTNWWRSSPTFSMVVVVSRGGIIALQYTAARKPAATRVAEALNRLLAEPSPA